mgnify:CR=1 FL=1
MEITYELFGGLRVARDGQTFEINSKIRRKILAALLLDVGRSVTTDRLIDSVWGDDPPSTRDGALRFHVSKLRDDIEPGRDPGSSGVVATTAAGYRVQAAPEDVDIYRWLTHLETAADELPTRPEQALRSLEGLLEEFEEPLPEFAYDEFALPTLRNLSRQRAVAGRMQVDALVALGRSSEAIAVLQAMHENDPYDEAVVARLVMSLYRSGQQAEALRTYDRTRERLVDELGIDPGPELEAAHLRVLRQDPQLFTHATAPGPPERGPRHNLPADPAPLIGREETLEILDEMLETNRLVTIAGLPGIGKSRVARAWARARRHLFSDGVIYLDLATVPEGARLDEDLAAALLSVSGRAVEPANAADELASTRSLLVLDNADDRSDLEYLSNQLLSGDSCRLLVTASRPPPVEAPVIALGGLSDDAAEALVRQHRKRRQAEEDSADLAAVVESCAGIPAALMLAATSLRLSSAEESSVAAAGHVGSAVAGVVAALGTEDRNMLAAVRQFCGPFGLADAEAASGQDTTIATLDSLMDQGLVRLTDGGLEVPEFVKQQAPGHADPSDEVVARYADQVGTWPVQKLSTHLPDVGNALGILAETSAARAENLLGRIAPWLWETGRSSLANVWTQTVLDTSDGPAAADLEKVLYYGIRFAMASGETDQALDLADRHRKVALTIGEEAELYAALSAADLAWFRGESEAAAAGYAATTALAQRTLHPEAVTALFGSGVVAAGTGDLELAESAAEQLIATGALHSIRWAHYAAAELLGVVCLGRHRLGDAIDYFHHARQSPRAVDRFTAGRRLVRAHLLNNEASDAETAWNTLTAELTTEGAAPDPAISFTGALLFDQLADGERRDHQLALGRRSVGATPAALWIAFGLAVIAETDPDHRRRSAASRLAAQHCADTGIRLLPPFGSLGSTGASGAADMAAIQRLLAV